MLLRFSPSFLFPGSTAYLAAAALFYFIFRARVQGDGLWMKYTYRRRAVAEALGCVLFLYHSHSFFLIFFSFPLSLCEGWIG